MPEPVTDQRVNLIAPDGSPVNVPASELDSALEGGYRVATEEETAAVKEREYYQSGTQQAVTAAEGGARGLTFGLSDLALSGLGADTEAMRKRKEANEGLALTSEVAGGLAPLAFTGGGSGIVQGGIRAAGAPVRALAQAGMATERAVGGVVGKGLLGRAVSVGAGGALEGGAIGAGQAVSSAVLEDEELTAERLIAGARDGALMGGAIGAAAGGVLRGAEIVAERAAPKLRELLSPQAVDDFVSDHAFAAAKGPGGGKKFVAEANQLPGGTSGVGKRLLNDGVVTKTSTVDDIAKAAKAKKAEYGERVGSIVKELDDVAPQARPTNSTISARVKSEVLSDLRETGSRELERVAKQVERELDGMELLVRKGDGPSSVGFQALHKKRQAIDRIAFPKSALAEPTQKQQALQKVRAIIEDEFNASAEKAAAGLGDDFAAKYSDAKAGYRDYRLVAKMSDDAVSKAGTNRNLSMSDMQVAQAAGIGDAMMGGGIDPGTLAVGLASGYAHKLLRERGAAFLAGSMHEMRKASSAAAKVERSTGSAVKRFFSTAKQRTKSAARQESARSSTRRQRFDKAAETVNKRATDPAGAIDVIAERMTKAGASDRVTSAYTAAVARGASFLKERLPAPIVRAGDRQPHLETSQRVASSEMAKFLRYSDAVKDPMTVVAAMERGDLTREGAEALRLVYPKMYEDLKGRVTDHVINSKERLPRSKLQQLSVLFDEPYHFSMEPGFMLAMQQAAAAPAQDAAQGSQGFIAPSARKAPDTAAQMMTNTQRLSQ